MLSMTSPASAATHRATSVEPVAPIQSEAMRDDPYKLTAGERRILVALASAALPGGFGIEGGGEITATRLERFISLGGPTFARAVRAGLQLAQWWPLGRYGRPLTALDAQQQRHAIAAWSRSSSRYARWLLRAIVTPIKGAHFDDPEVFAAIGCRYSIEPPADKTERWMRQITDGRQVREDLDLPCEVVVVGSGAGGAALAYELARRGRAVLLVERGGLHRRQQFTGRASAAYHSLYLAGGTTVALGNIAAPVWAGRSVGGTTTINSGTCYRAPAHTLARWQQQYGLHMLTDASLAPYYQRVEQMLGVGEAQTEHLGGPARVVARGAEAMGLSHRPLMRNAPDCDGQGVCCFGCPTGAKRSADVSWVPAALERGAQLVTAAHIDRIDVVAGRARGVSGRLRGGGRLRVRADAVVVAAGALMTPLLLAQSGVCSHSGWLGRNLSIHPAAKVIALFDEDIDMSRGIPQSYCIDSHAEAGIMFEGGSTPLDVTAMGIPWVGDRFMQIMAHYRQLATFGFMIQDTSRGRVRPGPRGTPLITYNLNDADTARMQRGIEILTEVFLRAGSQRVLPMVVGCDEVRDDADLAALRSLKLRQGDFEVTAFHPLGTCRMGTDPQRSCVGPDQQAHDTAGLYVSDGSALPSSLGVNPQMTIMALGLRTAERIEAALDAQLRSTAPAAGAGQPPAPAADDPTPASAGGLGLAFAETMRGRYARLEASGEDRGITFSIRAFNPSLLDFFRDRQMRIEGTVRAEGLATDRPLVGTMGLDLLRTGELPYDFAFTGDDGQAYRFSGHKTIRLSALRESFTTLPASVYDADGAEVARAELLFDLRGDLGSFLRSWRLKRQSS